LEDDPLLFWGPLCQKFWGAFAVKTSNLQAHASDPKDHLMVWVVGFASFLRNHQRKIAAKFWVTNTKRFESTDLELFLLTYV